MKPFLKWAGGKSQILNEIRAKYPRGLGRDINKYAEPFVGGGAVLFDILSRYEPEEVYVSDINRELIVTYQNVRGRIESLIAVLKAMEEEYLALDPEERRVYYYHKRERFNALKAAQSEAVEIAALFIFLNRTCFNGLYRVNRRGEFNVPMGRYKNPLICDEQNLRAVSRGLRGARIVCADYKKSGDFIDGRTFVYFDPPYRPLSATSNFTSYAQEDFDDGKQKELAEFIHRMSRRGAAVVASNSDPRNTDKGDDFFDRLYAGHNIYRIDAARAINAWGGGRGKIRELLIEAKGEGSG